MYQQENRSVHWELSGGQMCHLLQSLLYQGRHEQGGGENHARSVARTRCTDVANEIAERRGARSTSTSTPVRATVLRGIPLTAVVNALTRTPWALHEKLYPLSVQRRSKKVHSIQCGAAT